MSTVIKAAYRFIVRRTARSIALTGIAMCAAMIATPSRAVEYVKICSLYGAGFFYIPGTDTCTSAQQIVANQFGIARANTQAATGTAMAASLVAPWLPTGTNYAVSTHWAGYDGQNAVGFSGLMRLSGNFILSAGFAAGLDNGRLVSLSDRTQTEFGTSVPAQSWSNVRGLSRAGFMYAW
jgi:hypothetical protein